MRDGDGLPIFAAEMGEGVECDGLFDFSKSFGELLAGGGVAFGGVGEGGVDECGAEVGVGGIELELRRGECWGVFDLFDVFLEIILAGLELG